MNISGIIRAKNHSAVRFRFESFTFWQVKVEGRSLEFSLGKLKLVIIQYIVLQGSNPIVVIKGWPLGYVLRS